MCCGLTRVVAVVAALVFSVLCCQGVNVAAVKESVVQLKVADGERYLVEHNFLFGIASLGAFYENHTRCGQELELMLNAMAKHEVWGLKVLDSFGSPPKTFIWGNNFWFGTPSLCDDLNTPYTISLAYSRPPIFNATSPFPVRFVVVYSNYTTPYYINLKLPFNNLIYLGLCLPESCSVSKITSYTDAYFQGEYFEMQRNFKLKMTAFDAKATQFSWEYFVQTGSFLFITILVLTITLGIAAEISYSSDNANKHKTLTQYDAKKSSIWQDLLLCFRLSPNYKTVMSLQKSNSDSNFLTVMTGLRTIICLWITVFHVYYYSLFAISNSPYIFAKLQSLPLQPILQACFYVDVFFVMSSFLLVNNFLSNAKLIKNIQRLSWWGNLKLFLRSVLQRYMRLTPVMIITMLLSTMVLDFLNMYSPFRLAENSGLYCKNNWWYNLLYIQNFLDMNYICCSWTWYLACEMQYFILFTGLLFLHAKKPIAAKIVFITLALGLVVVSWMCNFANGITFEIDVIYSTLNQLYIKPWTRIPPYLGGAIMGWLMYTLQQRQHKHQHEHQHQHQQRSEQLQPSTQHQAEQHQGVTSVSHHPQLNKHPCPQQRDNNHPHRRVYTFGRKAFWIFCFILYVTTNFMSYWRSTPSWMVATIMSMGKLLFALCIGGVIIMCACGRGGWLNVFLSARPFLILNKFCFSIYMLAPVVVVGIFGLRNEPTKFTEVASVSDFVTAIAFSIISAFLMLVLVELPMQRITNRLLKQK